MTGRFDTVDDYIDAQPTEVQAIMERLRQTIREGAPGVEERISCSMPTFVLDGLPLVHLAAWKKHVAPTQCPS